MSSASVSAFRAGHAGTATYKSAKEMDAALAPQGIAIHGIAPGPFRARLDVASTAHMHLSRGEYAPGVHLHVTAPPGTVVVALHSASGAARNAPRNGFAAARVALVCSEQQSGLVGSWVNGSLVLVVDRARLARIAADRSLQPIETRARGGHVFLDATVARRRVAEGWGRILDRALLDPEVLQSPLLSSRMEAAAIATLLESLDSGPFPRDPPPEVRRVEAARRGEEFMREHLAEKIAVHAVAESAGMTVRSLERGFLEAFGVAPKAYLQILRLNAARHDLLDAPPGTTVRDVATRWCQSHLGRFASEYARVFGEAPGETLRTRRRARDVTRR